MTAHLSLDAVFAFPALREAVRRTALGKRTKPSCAAFLLTQERHLLDLRDALCAGRWRPSPARILRVFNPKPRRIAVPIFADRVVHQCLCAVLGPRHMRRAITHSYACRPAMGTHAALRLARAWAHTWPWWVRLDVARFFPSIDHELLRAQLAQDIPEAPLRALCGHILDADSAPGTLHFPGDDLFDPGARRVGLPLGNLTSQLWANRTLDPVDHFVKDRLRVRGYPRYMDDLLLFGETAAGLTAVARQVEEACHALRLRLHPWSVQRCDRGVGFVGYRILPDHVRVRRSSVRRAERRVGAELRAAGGDLRAVQAGLRSVFAHWDHADAWHLKTRTLRRLGLLYEPDEGV